MLSPAHKTFQEQLHFVGLAGSGMSALAQFLASSDRKISGSDRLFDSPEGGRDLRKRLASFPIEIVPQDGSGVHSDLTAVIVSTAVERKNPDLKKAAELGIPIRHRSECLRDIASEHDSIVVAGTSGKSTVTAMIWHLLDSVLGGVSVITGGPLLSLREKGLLGNAWNAGGKILVLEGDESDGTLTQYRSPAVSVLLNLSKDHKDLSELNRIFSEFMEKGRKVVVGAEAENLGRFREKSFYSNGVEIQTFGKGAGDFRIEEVRLDAKETRFTLSGTEFRLPQPGEHNALNAAAATAAASFFGVSREDAARALASFRGVHRRFETVGICDGVRVVDDFAHNPEKIEAAIRAARIGSSRVLAVYQPHGFFPTRFLFQELVESFSAALRPEDRLWIAPIYDAGGSTDRSVRSEDLAAAIAARGGHASAAADWNAIDETLGREISPGDVVLVMGARDPALHEKARGILRACCIASQNEN